MDVDLALLRARKLAASLRTPAGRAALRRHRVGPAIEHRHLAALGPRTIIDVGANRGQFALALAQAVPEAHIVAVEPGPDAFAVLEDVTAPFGERVTRHRVALGPARSTATLHLSASDDNSSLLPPGRDQLALARDARTVDRIEVPVVPLDDLIASDGLVPPVLLKIDVQGTEADVLRGATATLARVDVASVEVSFRELYVGHSTFAEVVGLLADAGLRLHGLHNPTRLGHEVIQADALFTRSPDHEAVGAA